jgi:hypothetical protein
VKAEGCDVVTGVDDHRELIVAQHLTQAACELCAAGPAG